MCIQESCQYKSLPQMSQACGFFTTYLNMYISKLPPSVNCLPQTAKACSSSHILITYRCAASHVLLLFLSIMYKHMSSQVVCPCKLLTTDVKGIWFLSSMNKHVLLEVSRLYEMLSKDITKVLFLSSINTHVLH